MHSSRSTQLRGQARARSAHPQVSSGNWEPSKLGNKQEQFAEVVDEKESESVKSLSHVWPFATPQTVAPRLLCPWDFSGKNPGVGSISRLQGVFPTRGLNPGILHCRQILYHLSHQGSPIYTKCPISYFFNKLPSELHYHHSLWAINISCLVR